jgi:hypothetical protein
MTSICEPLHPKSDERTTSNEKGTGHYLSYLLVIRQLHSSSYIQEQLRLRLIVKKNSVFQKSSKK